jgi:hypothetical protein
MRRLARHLSPAAAALSFALWLAAAALWVRTAAMGRTDTLVWGEAGAYRSVEFSGDDVEYKDLRDPGYGPTPLRWHARRGGWVRPPGPTDPAALPETSVTWVIPDTRGEFTPTRRGGAPRLGLEWETFAAWYGPGTSAHSARFSYFLVLLPAAVLPTAWLARAAVRRWRRGRYAPGLCRRCGYDLRATPERCPECGAAG